MKNLFSLKRFISLMLFVQLFVVGPALAYQFTLNKIKVKGLQLVTKDAVMDALPVQSGSKITEATTSDIIHSLFKTGFFEDIDLERAGNDLIVIVKERPVISEFEITGIKDKTAVAKILKQHDVAKGRMYNPNNIAKAKEELEIDYLKQGKYGVKIEPKASRVSDNKVELTISIYEGTQARVKRIKFIGNSFFSDKELTKQLYHQTTGLFSWFTKADRYSKEKLLADEEKIRSYYLDRGFLNVRLNATRVSLSPNKKDLHITFNIEEGDRYRFGKVSISGKYVVPKQDLVSILEDEIQNNAVFSRQKLWDAQKALEDRLGNEGYSKAKINFNLETRNNNTIDVDYFIDPLHRVYVRRIKIVGNTLTEDVVLRRTMPQLESSFVSTNNVTSSKEGLMRDGLAKEVEVKTEDVPGVPDQVDLTYKIQEERTAKLSAGVSYSQAEGIMFNIGADLRNFVGSGKDINFDFQRSKNFTIYSFGYYNPYFTIDGVGLGYNIYYSKTNYSKSSDIFNYSTNDYGADVNWSYPISEYERIGFGLGYDNIQLKFDDASAPTEATNFTNQEGKRYSQYSANIGWRRNTLDRYIFPTQGHMHSINLRVQVPPSKLKYYKAVYAVNWFKPITRHYIFAFTGRTSYGNKYGSTERYPFFRNEFLGGADDLRGFEEKSLGPKDSKGQPFGGNFLVRGTAELIFPTPFFKESKNVRTSVFLDAGQTYDLSQKYTTDSNGNRISRNPTGLRYSVGVSLKWHTPFGLPMVFSLAKPLNTKVGDKKQAFHFTFGTQLL